MKRARQPGPAASWSVRTWAGLLALVVHALFFALLVFSVDWKSEDSGPVAVELWSPAQIAGGGGHAGPSQQPYVPPPPPPPPPVAPPEPRPVPTPEAPSPPVGEPAADIALAEKKKQQQAKKLEQQRQQQEIQKQQQQQEQKQAALKLAQQQQQQQRVLALRQMLVQQTQAGIRSETEHALAGAQAMVVAGQQASRQQQRLLDEYQQRIRAKIRSRIILPDGLQGNPEAVFDVALLPTGEVLRVTLMHASGQPAYDDAVQRAIYKASPLPLPPDPQLAGMFRDLHLHFSPDETK